MSTLLSKLSKLRQKRKKSGKDTSEQSNDHVNSEGSGKPRMKKLSSFFKGKNKNNGLDEENVSWNKNSIKTLDTSKDSFLNKDEEFDEFNTTYWKQ